MLMARHRASRMKRSRLLSQARTRRRLWPTAVRMTLAASPSEPLRWQRAEMPVSLHMANDGFDGGATAQFALDDAEDAALLTGVEDAAQIGRVVTAVALVDIGALDRAATRWA